MALIIKHDVDAMLKHISSINNVCSDLAGASIFSMLKHIHFTKGLTFDEFDVMLTDCIDGTIVVHRDNTDECLYVHFLEVKEGKAISALAVLEVNLTKSTVQECQYEFTNEQPVTLH